jgi:hypothetical protein
VKKTSQGDRRAILRHGTGSAQAHLAGDEDAEHSYARELLARATASRDPGQRLRCGCHDRRGRGRATSGTFGLRSGRGRCDGQLVWWGELTDDRDDEEERVVLDRLTPEPGRVRIQVNSQHRLRQLEYQSALPAERGGRPVDTAWLRAELGGAAPLRLAAAQLRVLGLTSIL